MQYRGTLSYNTEAAVGVMLFAANMIMLLGPFIIIGLIVFRAMPTSLVQQFLGDDVPQIAPAASTTTSDATEKVGEVIMFKHCGMNFSNNRVILMKDLKLKNRAIISKFC